MDDERLEELSTIEAIFPELSRDPNNTFCASLELPVSPTNGLTVRFPATIDGVSTTLPTDDSDNRPDSPGSSVNEDKHALSHLPPLLLQITLPEGYPENAPPFVQISTSPAWLPPKSVQELEQYAAMMWEEYGHLQVVFSYIDYLQQAAERGFDIATQNGGVLALEQDMKISMLDLDIKTKKKIFDNETFECGVCLEPKKGSVCYRLRKCGHVFCVDCLKGVYNNAIQEGNIAQMICLEFGCGQEKAPGEQRAKKPARTLTPQELLQIPLERNMVQRYVDLKRKKRLESDPNTIYCPRKWCQGPAKTKKYPKRTLTDLREEEEASESEAEEEAPAPKVPTDLSTKQDTIDISQDRVRICEDCNYAFCRVCHLGWHGEFIRCWPRSNAERTEEEQASYDYIRMHTSPCPSCTVPCQKTQGCNHMNCYQCNTHFCYLCSSWLDPQNPYQHFNEEGRDCFQRLWELEEGDNGQGNVQFVGVRGAENAAIEAARLAREQDALEAAGGQADDPVPETEAENADLHPEEPTRDEAEPDRDALINPAHLAQPHVDDLIPLPQVAIMGAAVPNNPEPVPDADAVAAPDAAPAPVIDINLLAALEIQDEEAAADVLWLEFERNLGRGGANPAFQPRPAGQPRNRNRLPALEGGPANFRPEPYGLGAQRRFHGGGGGQVRRDDVDAFRYEDVGTDTEEENRVEPDEQVEGGGEDHLLDGNELPPREVDVSFVPARRGPGRGRGRRRGRNAGGPPVVDPSQVNGIDVGQAVDAGRAVDTVIEEQ